MYSSIVLRSGLCILNELATMGEEQSEELTVDGRRSPFRDFAGKEQLGPRELRHATRAHATHMAFQTAARKRAKGEPV